jgi:hypothetical protein
MVTDITLPFNYGSVDKKLINITANKPRFFQCYELTQRIYIESHGVFFYSHASSGKHGLFAFRRGNERG